MTTWKNTRDLITKTSYDFSQDYLKLDHKSIVSSRLTGTILYDLSYNNIIVSESQKAILGCLNLTGSNFRSRPRMTE